jgi:hypothetical protein
VISNSHVTAVYIGAPLLALPYLVKVFDSLEEDQAFPSDEVSPEPDPSSHDELELEVEGQDVVELLVVVVVEVSCAQC